MPTGQEYDHYIHKINKITMELTLKEKFVILAMDPEKGTNLIPTFIGHGIAGAVLLELAGLQKIKIEDNRIKLMDSKSTGDKQLDYMIEVLNKASKPQKVKNIVAKVQGKTSKLKKPIIEGLNKKRYLKTLDKRFLFIRYKRYPSANLSYRKDLVEYIRRLVLRNIKYDDDIALLTGLTGATRLSAKFFYNKEERKTAKKRIQEIVKESQIDQAIDETVKAVQAAVMTSIITTAVITSASN